ncbi:MAG: HEAT repeat domain-containing protein [Promethearchaeota archaeon]
MHYKKEKTVDYLGDNKYIDENFYWDEIEISKVDDKIVNSLLNYLKKDISDEFFMAFESILKLKNKISRHQIIELLMNLKKEYRFRKELLFFILNYLNGKLDDYDLLPKLYNPDFIVRAKTIKKIKQKKDAKYLKFLLPLLNDPDDSVRFQTISMLQEFKNEEEIIDYLRNAFKKEKNPIIKQKIKSIIE